MVQSNPFATRFIRPGAIEFLFLGKQSVAGLVEQLRRDNWHGQIFGPHGSGKSTLVVALVAALEAAGRRIYKIGGQSQETSDVKSLDSQTQVVVDGFEQLSWWARRTMMHDCRRQGAGLLVTAHSDMGLPTLMRTEPSLELARSVVAKLLPAGSAIITPDDISRAFDAAQGDIRETLFKLFDVYQQRCGSC